MLDVLVAEDDENVRAAISAALQDEGHRVTEASDGMEAASLLTVRDFDIAICDVRMPRLDGLALLRRIRRQSPRTEVVIMTSYGRAREEAESLREGAVEYVVKPFEPCEFVQEVVGPIAMRKSLLRKLEAARASARIVAVSPAMRAVTDRFAVLAQSDVPVILTGERGSGKELVARAIHAQGPRRNAPFVLADCARLSKQMEAAAGQAARETGGEAWLREALGGTLALDGVEHLTLRLQAHLARAVTDESVAARRSSDGQPLGVRIVTLTRERLTERMLDGVFLEHLYYRLCGVQLRVPALREREDDFCHLVVELLSEMQPRGRAVPTLSPGAWLALRQARWPGNVGQLRRTLERALAASEDGRVEVEHLCLGPGDDP